MRNFGAGEQARINGRLQSPTSELGSVRFPVLVVDEWRGTVPEVLLLYRELRKKQDSYEGARQFYLSSSHKTVCLGK